MLLDPLDVRTVAERGAHNRACALVDADLFIREDRYLEVVQGHPRHFADNVPVPLVVRVYKDAYHAVQQFRPRCGDLQHPVADKEFQVVEAGLHFLGLQLGLCDRGLALRAPQHGGFFDIGPAGLRKLDKGFLGQALGILADGGVFQIPVAGEAHGFPQRLELRLVFLRGLHALFAELAAGQIPRLDAGFLFHQALRREAVVVEPKGVKDVVALHALVSGDHLRLRIAENMADMQTAAHRRRRRVNRINGPGLVRCECVHPVVVPEFLHLRFNGKAVVVLFKLFHLLPSKI